MANHDSVLSAPAEARRPWLWGPDFLLLLQGQLVSGLGDAAYQVALGFWILAATGSTALMGSLMAATALPRILAAPFAGVVVDRTERRWLLIAMDLGRGISVVAVAAAALTGIIQVWMVFAAGIVIGLGGAFFSPAVSAAIPDLVPREKLVQANSSFQLIQTGSGIVGNSAGGILYQTAGAPVLFLVNGLSYIFSSLMLLLMRIPRAVSARSKQRFLADMKDGLALVWRSRGVRALFLIASAMNFFATIGIVLLLPLFRMTPELGPARYGITMGFLTGGLFVGFAFASAVGIPPRRRYSLFVLCGMGMTAAFALFALVGPYPLKLALVAAAGFLNAIVNSFIPAILQLVVPPDMRGKVFSLLTSLAQGLTPVAMALGGVLAEFLPLKELIAASFAATFLFFVPFLFSQPFQRMIRFDPAVDSPEAVLR